MEEQGGSADSTVDDAGDERGLESTMTVLGVYTWPWL